MHQEEVKHWKRLYMSDISKSGTGEIMYEFSRLYTLDRVEEQRSSTDVNTEPLSAPQNQVPEDAFGSVPFLSGSESFGKVADKLTFSEESISKVQSKDQRRSHSSKEHRVGQKTQESSSSKKPTTKEGAESESDFESDPPSPKSSEDDYQEDEETLQGEQGVFNDDNDTEPEIIGQRPLLMDSDEEQDEEEEEKHSSDSECDRKKISIVTLKNRNIQPANPAGEAIVFASTPKVQNNLIKVLPNQQLDAFGAVPFFPFNAKKCEPPENSTKDVTYQITSHSQRRERELDEFDVFSKAPFSKKADQIECLVTPTISPGSVDIFGCPPFQPATASEEKSLSREDLFGLVPFEDIAGNQTQHKMKQQRNLQKLSSRQRRTKQEPSNNNGKRHHGTPSSTKKAPKPNYRTPERVRRHKKGGRRDSQSSNEFFNISDSKENISVTMADGKDLQADESMVDSFGAKPFHPQDLRQPQHQGLADNRGDHHTTTVGRSRQSSLHGVYHSGDNLNMDDFGAVPFTELVLQSVTQQQSQQPQQQPIELDPFGAAPFPSKQ
ncbi:putative BMP-2-inducible kinase-like protein [Discoglossus pictus]